VVGAHDHNHGTSHMEVKFYHIHPGYNASSLLNDIMLLQVNDSARFFKLYAIQNSEAGGHNMLAYFGVCSDYNVLAPSIPIILIKIIRLSLSFIFI